MTTTETQVTEKPKFKVLGVNDDRDFCECCGRSALKKVVWIQNEETGVVQHFGVICALNPAKAFGLRAEVKSAEGVWKRKLETRYRLAHSEYRKRGGKYVSSGEYSVKVIDHVLYAECFAATAK